MKYYHDKLEKTLQDFDEAHEHWRIFQRVGTILRVFMWVVVPALLVAAVVALVRSV